MAFQSGAVYALNVDKQFALHGIHAGSARRRRVANGAVMSPSTFDQVSHDIQAARNRAEMALGGVYEIS